jgi:hypothetical protein
MPGHRFLGSYIVTRGASGGRGGAHTGWHTACRDGRAGLGSFESEVKIFARVIGFGIEIQIKNKEIDADFSR